ncbi:MAG: septum formation initiator family protein [Rectinemataceae bacterium]
MSLGTLARSGSGTISGRHGAARAGYRLALSLYAGFTIYCTLSVLIGPAGFLAYRRLEAKKTAMEANLGKLGTLRENLNAELESLKSDPDRAAREARSLGYLRKGETVLLLGDRIEQVKPIETGKVLPYAEPTALGDLVLKEISLGASIALMALLFAPRTAADERKRSLRRG